jgi:1,4-alpha-glucan branching enzyme
MKQYMKTLPIELVDLILEYQGYHSWRNGKYICRLQLDDTYEEVKRRPMIQLDKTNTFNTCFTKINEGTLYKYNIHTAIYSGKIHWYMDIYTYYSRHKYKKNKNCMTSYLTKTVHYVFEHNEKQHLPIIHI